MAIAKVQYKENASAAPEVWMDTTQKTVTAGTMLSGTTALKNDGTGITGNIASKSSSDLTASGATVTAPAGYYAEAASKSVASGSAGTPTATKGTVSSNSVTVTPSVTNITGYITGATLTGTAVTVSASELVSGTKSITSSGTTDVTNYASASVAAGTAGTPTATKGTVSNHSISVTPSVTNTTGYITGSTISGTAVTVDVTELESGTKSITENGTGISVSGYSAVDVDVPGQVPTGVKYIYTDIDGEGAWNVAGYEYCSVDYAPVWDGSLRYWFNIPSANYTQTINYYISNDSQTGPQGIIDWGDGTIDTSLESASTASHEYASAGRYCVKITPTGARGRTYAYVAGNNLNTDNTTLVGAECIDIGTTTKQVAGSSFRRCTNLKKVSIKNDIEKISSYAFAYSGISELTIPSSVTTIDSYCFQNSSLLKIHMKPTSPPTLGTAAFQFTSSSLVIYVPQGYLPDYQGATNWSSYASQMQEE